MRIDNELNLIIPVEIGGVSGWVHVAPLSFEIWERYYKVITMTSSQLYSQDMFQMGPKIAHLVLKECAERVGVWNDVSQGLVAEINRLTNVVMPGEHGMEVSPFYTAMKSGALTPRDISEIQGIVTFFIVTSAIHGVKMAEYMPVLRLWGARSESLSCTGFAASLPTSTEVEHGVMGIY
jgi:hypothetical protein